MKYDHGLERVPGTMEWATSKIDAIFTENDLREIQTHDWQGMCDDGAKQKLTTSKSVEIRILHVVPKQ